MSHKSLWHALLSEAEWVTQHFQTRRDVHNDLRGPLICRSAWKLCPAPK